MRKPLIPAHIISGILGGAICILFALITGCGDNLKNSPEAVSPASLSKNGAAQENAIGPVRQVNLVADLPGFAPNRIDGTLLNAWGIAMNPTGIIWISANHSGFEEVYDSAGNQKRGPVFIPGPGGSGTGAPTGVVFNPGAAFLVPATGTASRFIFDTEDGTILAWASGDTAKIAIDHSSSGDVFKGLAIGQAGSKYFIYATDFHNGKIEAFDDHWIPDASKMFNDPGIPAGFAPFGIQNIDGLLYVTYAMQKGPDNMDDQAGPGNGYVDIFDTGGNLLRRFASQGALNSPWGIAKIPDDGFGGHEPGVLIGNFGDGRVTVFDKNGHWEGQLADSAGNVFVIPGLWGLMFRQESDPDAMTSGGKKDGHQFETPEKEVLFFTAGPNDENDGVFGNFLGVSAGKDHHEKKDENDHRGGRDDHQGHR